jgi:outer membrane protein
MLNQGARQPIDRFGTRQYNGENMRLRLIACLAGAMATGPLLADDLMTAYREGLASDAAYGAARASYQASKEKIVQGRALLLPNINLTANANYNNVNTEYGKPIGLTAGTLTYGTYGAGLNLTQPLYRQQNNVIYEQAGIQVTQAESQLILAGQDLMLRVSQAYFDVLRGQYQLLNVQAQKSATSEQLAQAKRNFEVGTATITDTYDAQARYDLIVAREIAATNDMQVKVHALQQIIGRLPGPLNTVVGPVTLNAPEPNDMERWVEAAYANSLQVKIAKYNLDIAVKEVDKNRYANYPTLDAVAGANYSYQGDSTLGTSQGVRSGVVGLQFAIPIYSGGSLSSRVREAIANRTKAEQDLEAARRTVAQAVRQSFIAVNTSLSEIKALQQAVASNKLSVEATKLGQEVGVRTQVDVLNALGLLFDAQFNLVNAYYVAILAQLKLKGDVGKLTDVDIENVNRLLQPPTAKN